MNKKFLYVLVVFLFLELFTGLNLSLFSQTPLSISKDFTLFTTENLKGFATPLFTSIEQGLNSNIYTSADIEERFYFGLDISAMGMFIPSSQKNFNAQRPEEYGNIAVVRTAELRNGQILKDYTKDNIQPTIYGGQSTSIFAVPQTDYYKLHKVNGTDSMITNPYKSASYVEGNNISFMSGLPTMQLIIGIPTRTEFRFRFWGAPVQDEMLWYWGITANQQFDHWFKIFKPEQKMALALNGAYHSISRNPGLNVKSWAVGINYSKIWDFHKSGSITGYLGVQLEDLKASFEAVKDTSGMTRDIIDSPYLEVRDPMEYARQQGWYDENGKPKPKVLFNVESQNKYRITGGFSYKYSFLEIHVDAAYASQPILTAGLTFWFGGFGGKEKIEPKEKIERLD